MNIIKDNFITHKELLNEMLKDKDFKREYDALRPKYEIIENVIRTRINKNQAND